MTGDLPSVIALTPYTLWVIGYHIPSTYALWQLNPVPEGWAG